MHHGIDYSIKESKRAKHLKIVVKCDASVSIVTPVGFNIKKVDGLVAEKAEWIRKKILLFKNKKRIETPKEFAQTNYYSCSARAKKMIIAKIEHYNTFYNFKFNRVSIRKQTTRWGSCSGRGNLNFNYKILFLPAHLADYIIVHELCHLREMNHSHRFWKLVGQVVPDYKERRKELRGLFL